MAGHLDFSEIRVGIRYSRALLARLWELGGPEALKRGVFTPSGGVQVVLFVTQLKDDAMTGYADRLDGAELHWDCDGQRHNVLRMAAQLAAPRDEIHVFFRDLPGQDFIYCGTARVMAADLTTAWGSFLLRLDQSNAAIVHKARLRAK